MAALLNSYPHCFPADRRLPMPSTSNRLFSALKNKLSTKSNKSRSLSSSKTNSWSTATGSTSSAVTSRQGSVSTALPLIPSSGIAPNSPQSSVSHDEPPAYAAVASSPLDMEESEDNRFAFLSKFDVVFLIDDSSSMIGSSWRQTRDAIAAITPICTAYDADGIDIYFLNEKREYQNIKVPSTVAEIFSTVSPRGATPTGQRLHKILKDYLVKYARCGESLKPLNIIVITDGEPTDDLDSSIIAAAKKLDAADAPPWQVGIQFFQVGSSPHAREHLKYLDDNLVDRHGKEIRDMVDTVPWTNANGGVLNAEGILKVVLGAVNRRLDRSGINLHEMRY